MLNYINHIKRQHTCVFLCEHSLLQGLSNVFINCNNYFDNLQSPHPIWILRYFCHKHHTFLQTSILIYQENVRLSKSQYLTQIKGKLDNGVFFFSQVLICSWRLQKMFLRRGLREGGGGRHLPLEKVLFMCGAKYLHKVL